MRRLARQKQWRPRRNTNPDRILAESREGVQSRDVHRPSRSPRSRGAVETGRSRRLLSRRAVFTRRGEGPPPSPTLKEPPNAGPVSSITALALFVLVDLH